VFAGRRTVDTTDNDTDTGDGNTGDGGVEGRNTRFDGNPGK